MLLLWHSAPSHCFVIGRTQLHGGTQQFSHGKRVGPNSIRQQMGQLLNISPAVSLEFQQTLLWLSIWWERVHFYLGINVRGFLSLFFLKAPSLCWALAPRCRSVWRARCWMRRIPLKQLFHFSLMCAQVWNCFRTDVVPLCGCTASPVCVTWCERASHSALWNGPMWRCTQAAPADSWARGCPGCAAGMHFVE